MKKLLIIVMCVIMLLALVSCTNNDDMSVKCTHCGETIANNLKFCPHCGETVFNSSGDNNNEEQQTEAQSSIKVYDVFVSDIDSADGVDMKIAWENTSSKTIKYIYFTVEAYNAVDDKVACELRDSYQFISESTGPFESGYTNLIYDAQKDSYSVSTVFENCYYNSNIRYFEITNIRIVYMDNTEFELDEDSVDYAFAEIPQGLYYTWNDEYNGYEVNYRLKSECTSTEITIPSTYNNSNVVAVSNGAFRKMSIIQSIILPDTIQYIGGGAFDNCVNLSSVTLSANSQLTEIAQYAFYGCTSLTEFSFPNSINVIGCGAFANCSSLTNVIIPEKITTIEEFLFFGCTSLTDIIIHQGVTLIYTYAFHCPNLTNIVIPNTVTFIDEYAFSARNIESVYYGGNASEWEKIDIGSYNGHLVDSIRYYYSETIPDEEGNYWHYVNGVPTPWTIK